MHIYSVLNVCKRNFNFHGNYRWRGRSFVHVKVSLHDVSCYSHEKKLRSTALGFVCDTSYALNKIV